MELARDNTDSSKPFMESADFSTPSDSKASTTTLTSQLLASHSSASGLASAVGVSSAASTGLAGRRSGHTGSAWPAGSVTVQTLGSGLRTATVVPAGHLLPSGHGGGRRESFLYRGNVDEPFYNFAPFLSTFRPGSRASSVASSDPQHGEDFIVTPFAQLLASLRNVRVNLASIANAPPQPAAGGRRGASTSSPIWPTGQGGLSESTAQQCALETLEELDWCLDQLEAIQTHRSVTEMASSKFRKLLNKELSHFAESSKSGTQISKFLINTYMEDRGAAEDAEESRNAIGALRGVDAAQQPRLQQKRHSHFPGADCAPFTSSDGLGLSNSQPSFFNKAKTVAMSRISGFNRLCAEVGLIGAELPEFGVYCQREIHVYMQSIDNWGVDIFKVHEMSKQHSLTAVTYTLLRERSLLATFDILPATLVTYLLHLEHHYRPNPYHNQIHAADVTQSIHVLISSPALEGVFSDLEVLAAIVAAAIHDVDHPGYTNQYLINTNSELAIMYNDESVLEQYHLAVAFKLLQKNQCDFLVGLSKKQRQTFRKIVIEMVLATDMSKHMTLLADLKTMVEAKKVSSSSVVMLDKYNDRIQVLQSMIHLADLSNPTKPIEIYRQWNERILEEYWRQGDKEKEQNLEVSPMCDRGNVTIEKSQVGFIDYIVHPLFETWAELVYPDAQSILDQLEDNRQWYLARIDPEDRPPEPNIIESLASSAVSSAVISRERFVPAAAAAGTTTTASAEVTPLAAGGGDCASTDATISNRSTDSISSATN